MTPHILIIVSIAVMPVSEHTGYATYSKTKVGSTWPSVTMQRFEDRDACEHAAKQIRAMAARQHDLRMTCQPASIAQKERP